MNIKLLRKLAKSTKYQTLYSRAKEMSSINLYNNHSDFSRIQLYFLQFLEIYHSLYYDMALQKPEVNEDVINDELRTEAYLLYKRKTRNQKKGTPKKNTRERIDTNAPSVIFTRK